MLAASLKKDGHQVVLTREPTHGPAGQRLQSYLLGPSRHLSPAEELDLFMADRREHVAQIIKPALERGKVVLTDRYYYSSVAYQGALGLDPNDILAANEAFAPVPDLVSWPGIGKWMVDSIFRRDYPAVQGGLLLIAAIVMIVNLAVDLLYGLINPQIRYTD